MNRSSTEKTMEKTQEKRNISLSVDNLEDIILPPLKTISPAQWASLSQGVMDSHVGGVMADILGNILQRCVGQTLRILIPEIEERMQACIHTEMPDQNIRVHLTSLISTEMATALGLTPETCESDEELNSLMEQEVSQCVTSIANEIRRTHSFPEVPGAKVISYFPKMNNFNKMISNAVDSLKKHLSGARTRCAERYWSVFTKKQTSSTAPAKPETSFGRSEKSVSPDVKSHLSLVSLSERICHIIDKYADDATDAKDPEDATEFCSEIDLFEIILASERISQTILEDLHYCKSGDSVGQNDQTCSCVPHFELKKIIGDIRQIFSSKLRTAPAGKQGITGKPEFSKFVETQFANMVASLRKLLDSCDAKVVKLKRCNVTSNEMMSRMCPGCVPQLSEEESVQSVDHVDMKQKSIPHIDFKSITPQIDKLCAESLENPHRDDIIKELAKELTDRLYAEIMRGHYNKIPVPPKGKFLSDCVISCKKIQDISGQIQICPEVFYATTEDEVMKFLQKICFWLEKEETDQISVSDRVSNVLSEIDDLVGQIIYKVTKSQSSGTTSPDSCSSEDKEDSSLNVSSEFTEQPEDLEGDQISVPSHTDSLILTQKIAADETSLRDSSTASNQQLEKGMALFVLDAVLKCSEERGGPLKTREIKEIFALWSEDDVEETTDSMLTMDNKNFKQLVRDVCKELEDRFGSDEDMFYAVISQRGLPAQRAVLRCLKRFLPEQPQRLAFHRFFSGIMNLFRCMRRSPTSQ